MASAPTADEISSSPVAVVAEVESSTADWGTALVQSCRTWWPEATIHIVTAGDVPPIEGAQVWKVADFPHGPVPITGVLTETDQLAWVMPQLLGRLLDDYDTCVFIPAGCLVIRPPMVAIEAARIGGAAIATPAPITPLHSLTPALGRLTSRPSVPRGEGEPHPDRLGAIDENDRRRRWPAPQHRIVVVTPRARPLLRDWTRTVDQAIHDVEQRSVAWATEHFVDYARGRADVVVEGEHTLIHWSNYAAVEAGRAEGPEAAVIDCDTLFETTRGLSMTDDAEVAWSMLVHRVHDARPMMPLLELIASAETVRSKNPPSYFDEVVAQVRRASDPNGLRWGIDDASFIDWLYERNTAGCSRLAHLACLINDDLFYGFPDVRFDPGPFRKWVSDGGREELGFDPFDKSFKVRLPVSVPRRRVHPLAWRLTKLLEILPGHVRRRARKWENDFLGPDPRLADPISAPIHRPVERSAPLWGVAPRALNVIGPFRSESGLGQAARSSLAALRHMSMPFTHVDTTEMYPSRNAADAGLDPQRAGVIGDVNFLHTNADEMLWLRQSAFKHRLGGRFNAAMWFWEPAAMTDRSRASFHMVDELWVASRYVQGVFGQYGRVPVHVVGLAAELPEERTPDRSRFGWKDDELVFLFVYDALSSYGRKNPRLALDAFIRAFGPDFDKVRFVLKVSNLNKFPANEAEIRALERKYPAITVIDEYQSRDAVLDLMAAADIFISLHGAEGLGLTLLEAMAVGTPVVATGYSGNMDFTTEENSWLVDYDLFAIEERTGPYPPGSVWAKPRRDTAVDILKHIGANRDEIAVKAARAIVDAREAASVDRYARKLKERLDTVL